MMDTNLLSLQRRAMESWFAERGEKPFRARQVMAWIYQRQTTDIDAMTDLAKSLRAKLQSDADIRFPEVVAEKISTDGTRKWLLKLADDNCIETVFIPEATRATLCVSSQVGCALNCTFCATARQGFNRNLTVDEIIAQVCIANRLLSETDDARRVTNVVMMGMGEPLLNFDNVVAAMDFDDGRLRVWVVATTRYPEHRRRRAGNRSACRDLSG